LVAESVYSTAGFSVEAILGFASSPNSILSLSFVADSRIRALADARSALSVALTSPPFAMTLEPRPLAWLISSMRSGTLKITASIA
jgi:hypothetical protein